MMKIWKKKNIMWFVFLCFFLIWIESKAVFEFCQCKNNWKRTLYACEWYKLQECTTSTRFLQFVSFVWFFFLRSNYLKKLLATVRIFWNCQFGSFSNVLFLFYFFLFCGGTYKLLEFFICNTHVKKFRNFDLALLFSRIYVAVNVHFFFLFCFSIDHLRACLVNSSNNSSRSLFLGIFPTNSRWLLNDIVTPIFLPFRIS